MSVIVIAKDVRFFHKGTKPVVYKKGQKVETSDEQLIAWNARHSEEEETTAPAAALSVNKLPNTNVKK